MKTHSRSVCGIAFALFILAQAAFGTTYSQQVITPGSDMGSIDGIELDHDDNLYVANFHTSTIRKLSPSGSLVRTWGLADEVSAVPDVVVGPDNLLYFIQFFDGAVKRINADGSITTIGVVSAPGTDGIAFDRNGRLFVTTLFPGLYDELWEVDPTGANAPVLRVVNPGYLNQFAFGPDNLLYGPTTFGDAVLQINVDTGTIVPVAQGLVSPIVVKFDHQGRLHVVDEGARALYRVDIATGAKTTILAGLDPGTDALAFDSSDEAYFGSAGTGYLGRLRADGEVKTIARSGMVFPGGLTVVPSTDGKDELWVADFFSVRKIDGKHGKETQLYAGNSASQFLMPGPGFPSDISAGPNGTFVLTSFFLGQVRVWNPATNATALYGPFNGSVEAVAFGNDVAVSEIGFGQVVRASDHAVLGAGLALPTGLVAKNGDLYVAEWVTGSIKKIVADGVVLAQPVVVATGLIGPEGMSLDAGGDGILVVEAMAQRLTHVDLTTGTKSVIATGLAVGAPPSSGEPPTGLTLSGVGVGARGVIYVTGDAGRVVYKLEPVP